MQSSGRDETRKAEQIEKQRRKKFRVESKEERNAEAQMRKAVKRRKCAKQ